MKKTKPWTPPKKEDQELLHMLEQLSPEAFRRVLRDANAAAVRMLSEISKTPEELMQWRDKMLAPSPFPQPPGVVESREDLKKQFHEKILERRGSPFKTIKGGRRKKRIRQTLKGTFDL
jgi:hypothetical protein